MAKVGRRPKLTPEIQERICNLLKLGNYKETAARASGIAVSTLYLWMDKGRQDVEAEIESAYSEFLEAIESAEADGEAGLLLKVRSAANESWQAAAWMLERKSPERYARRVVVASDEEKPVPFAVIVPPKAEDEKQWAASVKPSKRK